ncbi:hypothetical protein Y032_0042g613 [Ancylostoma ceylanicum]|uniref:Major sperm protein n=1 Tax=Ancylostoma ceylanicum TaxID=53326 RepID=A0A016UH51_9BILA|nr:hypothetical protein Y032_0042g613 [Ancylostoma ceylanicum]
MFLKPHAAPDLYKTIFREVAPEIRQTVRALFNGRTPNTDRKRSDGHCRALGRSLQNARTVIAERSHGPMSETVPTALARSAQTVIAALARFECLSSHLPTADAATQALSPGCPTAILRDRTISLYVPIDNSKPQFRRLIFRNNSNTDIVVKLVNSKPHVVELARDRLRLLPTGSLFIEIKINSGNLGTFEYLYPKIYGYAMPVFTHTLPKIGPWLNTPGVETKKQFAFELQIKFNNNVFSARDTIIELPGSACLVEPVPRSIPLIKEDSPVDTADIDTYTAVRFSPQEDVMKNAPAEKGESCWFLTDILNSNYNPMSGMVIGESQVMWISGFRQELSGKLIPIQRDPSIATAHSERANNASCKTAVEKPVAERPADFVNVEQEATPCGGS